MKREDVIVRARRSPLCSARRMLIPVSAAVVTMISAGAMPGALATASARETGVPKNAAEPSISGSPAEHRKLKALRGSWVGGTPMRYSYAWSRCDADGGECHGVPGATKAAYLPVTADVGHRLLLTVTASNREGSAKAGTVTSSVVAAAPPKRRGHPTISGETVDGRIVTVGNGSWKGTPPFTYAYQWKRCSQGACTVIADAKAASYRVQTADLGKRLKATVTATNEAGSASAVSRSSAKVLPGSPLNLIAPTISGTVLPGQLLVANGGEWVGTPPIAYAYQWFSCTPLGGCMPIAEATEPTHTVGAGEIGDSFTVEVTATNAQGSASATSPETGVTGGGVEKPANVLPPSITGLTVTGQSVSATQGVWKGTEPSFSYQWELCDAAGASCGEISGATESTFAIPDGDAGHTLRVVVTASNSAGSASAGSEHSSEILGVGPQNTDAPTISGTATAGQLLTASSGKWSGTEPITFEYEWLRCNTAGAECSTAAATSVLPTYSVVPADVGHALKVKVIGKNVAGKGEAESPPTAEVGGVKPANAIAPVVTGLAVSGQTLTATEGGWTGTEPITYAFRWQQCSKAGSGCEDITGAKESKYTIANGDAGHTLRMVVTAKNVAGATEKESATTSEVLGVAPKNTEAPAISGSAKEGQLLTASSGKWTGTEPITFEYEWLRCTGPEPKDCSLAAAQSILSTYTAAAADVGRTLRVNVIAKNLAGTAHAESLPTATVAGIIPTNTIVPLIVGTATSGSTVEGTEGTWTGTQPITYALDWKLCTSATSCKTELTGDQTTAKKFKIPAASGGKKLRLNVLAKNAAGEASKEAIELSILL